MNYQQAIDYLFHALPMYQRVGAAAYKGDLANATKLDRHFRYPHKKFSSIHVAGTNGKGSVCHILASVLQETGYKTGLYTSPHLLDFRERIRINGVKVEEQFVSEFTERNLPYFKKLEASFFEMTVFMAFMYFAKHEVDIAIIEVGLGGRLDTTNIISPVLSVITNIGLDHTRFLGNTLEPIAYEKAGIIKNHVPVIVGRKQKEIQHVFEEQASKQKSPLYYADKLSKSDYRLQNMDHSVQYHLNNSIFPEIREIDTDLQGGYQEENIITSLGALSILNQTEFPTATEAIKRGLRNVVRNTGLLGRWQEISYNPLVVCDTAHNHEGIAEVVSQIVNTAHKQLFMIMGFVSDKPLDKITSILLPDAHYLLVEPKIPRAAKNSEVEILFKKYNFSFSSYTSIGAAYNFALGKSTPNDIIVICGSTFLVADLLAWKNSGKTF